MRTRALLVASAGLLGAIGAYACAAPVDDVVGSTSAPLSTVHCDGPSCVEIDVELGYNQTAKGIFHTVVFTRETGSRANLIAVDVDGSRSTFGAWATKTVDLKDSAGVIRATAGLAAGVEVAPDLLTPARYVMTRDDELIQTVDCVER